MLQEIRQYKDKIIEIFNKIEKESDSIQKAAEIMADAIIRDEIIHIVGTGGHSSIAAEEMFSRPGGLAPINAILDAGVSLIHGAVRSTTIERCEGYGLTVFESYGLGKKPGEIIIIANAYGINPMTIDIALEAKRRQMKVIAVTSRSFADNVPAGAKMRHSSNKNLYEIADVFIDCNLPYGDAVAEIAGVELKVAPASTLCNVFSVNCLLIATVTTLVARGVKPPVFISGNVPGSDEINKDLINKYGYRLKHF